MLKFRCAWKDCKNTCTNPADLPPSWVAMVTFRKTNIPGILDFATDQVMRDAVLCPIHSSELERCLTPMSFKNEVC